MLCPFYLTGILALMLKINAIGTDNYHAIDRHGCSMRESMARRILGKEAPACRDAM